MADREARFKASQTSFSAAAPSLPDKGDAGEERAIPPNPVPLPCARKRLSGGEDPSSSPQQQRRALHILSKPAKRNNGFRSREPGRPARRVLVQTTRRCDSCAWATPAARTAANGKKGKTDSGTPRALPGTAISFCPGCFKTPVLFTAPLNCGGDEAWRSVPHAHTQKLQRTKSPPCHCLPGNGKTDGLCDRLGNVSPRSRPRGRPITKE